MVRVKPFAALLAVGPLVVACAELQPDVLARKNPSLYSIHQPVVQRTDYVLDVASSGNGLPTGETERLRVWFDSLQLGYGDHVSVDPGTAFSDPAAREDIARVATEYGVVLDDGAPVTAGAIQPGALRVILSRMNASVPGCPDWSNAKLSGGAVTTETNYGCATNSNLAAMIADPNDLVLGQVGAAASASEAGAKAVKGYRDKAATAPGALKTEK